METKRGCDYCALGKPLVNDNGLRGLSIHDSNKLISYGNYDGSLRPHWLVAMINYCPMCGRKLEDDSIKSSEDTKESCISVKGVKDGRIYVDKGVSVSNDTHTANGNTYVDTSFLTYEDAKKFVKEIKEEIRELKSRYWEGK